MKLTKTKLKQIIKEELNALKEAKEIKEGVFDKWAKSRREDKTWGSWRDAKDKEEVLYLLENSLSDIRDGYDQYAYTETWKDAPMDKKQKAAEVVKKIDEALETTRKLRPPNPPPPWATKSQEEEENTP
jgi:hypothetical protein